MKRIREMLYGTFLVVVVAMGSCEIALAESAADFFRKNTVTLVVTYGPGGGTDAIGRIMAYHWKMVAGGRMIIRNLPGAGGLRAMNLLYRAKPDGRTLGYTDSASSLLGPVIFKNPGIEFDATKFTYLAANAHVPNGIAISPRLSANSIEDMQKISGLKFGSLSIDSQAATSALTIDIFGLKDARIVIGYGGMEEAGLALARGEVDANSNVMHSIKDHIGKGFVKKVALVYAHERNAWFPDTPLPTELVKLTPKQKKMYHMVISLGSVKPIFAPPGLSKEKTAFLRDTLQKIFKMDSYLKKMKVRFPIMGPDFNMTAEEWTDSVNKAMAIPTAEREEFINLVKSYIR